MTLTNFRKPLQDFSKGNRLPTDAKPEECPIKESSQSPSELVDPDVIVWEGAEDKGNPHNWSIAKRSWTSLVWILMTLVTSIQSSVFSSTNGSISAEFGVSEEVAVLGTSLFILVSLNLTKAAVSAHVKLSIGICFWSSRVWPNLGKVWPQSACSDGSVCIFCLLHTHCRRL
jgi:hypothetical protein